MDKELEEALSAYADLPLDPPPTETGDDRINDPEDADDKQEPDK